MGQRKSRAELEALKEKYNVMTLFSWSRYSTWCRDKYEYYLKYVVHAKGDRRNSIYGPVGGFVHDMLEDYYLDNLAQNEMAEKYINESKRLSLMGFRFDRSNKEKNETIKIKYDACNQHFLDNFTKIECENMTLERFLIIKIKSFIFQGYSDFEGEEIRDDKKKMIITDFKTSSMYKGEKIIKERGQLLLYALGKIQEGWDIDDVIIRWLFTKYVNVEVPTKNATRTRIVWRSEIGSALGAGVKAELKKCRIWTEEEAVAFADQVVSNKTLKGLPSIIYNHFEDDDDIETTAKGDVKKSFHNKIKKVFLNAEKYPEDVRDDIALDMFMTNDIKCVPEEVRCKFVISDCFVEIPFTQEDVDELHGNIIKFVAESYKLKMQYDKSCKDGKDGDDMLYWQDVDDKETYFLNNLCEYSPKIHKPFAEYLDKRREERNEPKYEDPNVLTEDEENEEMLALYAELGVDIRD